MTRRKTFGGATPPAIATDAKLIGLGKQLEEIQKKLRPIRSEHLQLGAEADDYARQRTGWEHGPDNPSGLFERYADAHKEMSARNGFGVCDRKLEALHRELEPIMRGITRTPATSAAGLRVKVAAAIEANDDLWDEAIGDLDCDKEAVRSLIEAVCTVVGVSIPSARRDLANDARDEAISGRPMGSAALN